MTSSDDIVRYNLQLPAPLKDKLDEAAARQGRSLAAVVRTAIEEYVTRDEEAAFVAELRATYGAVREEDLALGDALEGMETEAEEGQRDASGSGGRVSRGRGSAHRVRRGSGDGTTTRRRPPGKRTQ
jgi:predicted DNA-binding protein